MKTYAVEATLVNEYGKIGYKYKFIDQAIQAALSATFTKGDRERVWFSESEISKVASQGCKLTVVKAPTMPIVLTTGSEVIVSHASAASIL